MSSSSSIDPWVPPLTTIFTPPSDCIKPATLTLSADYIETHDGRLTVWRDPPHSSCMPPNFWKPGRTSIGTDGRISTTATSFSPGLYCPVGYTTVTEMFLEPSKIYARCCPSYVLPHSLLSSRAKLIFVGAVSRLLGSSTICVRAGIVCGHGSTHGIPTTQSSSQAP